MSNTTMTSPQPSLVWGFNQDEDTDLDWEWECLCDELTSLMQKINKGDQWHCTVENFGWQSRSGWKNFKANSGRNLLQQILPNTNCHFKIFVEGKGFGRYLKIQNFHHDSPDGREIYIVKRLAG